MTDGVIVTWIGKWLAKALEGPERLTRPIQIATLSVAERLAGLVSQGIAEDLRMTKRSLQRVQDAEAAKRVAEAADLHNRAVRAGRSRLVRKREAELELKEKAANVELIEAQAFAVRSDAETRRANAEASARAEERIINAMLEIHRAGGQVYVDGSRLRHLSPADDSESSSTTDSDG